MMSKSLEMSRLEENNNQMKNMFIAENFHLIFYLHLFKTYTQTCRREDCRSLIIL